MYYIFVRYCAEFVSCCSYHTYMNETSGSNIYICSVIKFQVNIQSLHFSTFITTFVGILREMMRQLFHINVCCLPFTNGM